MEDNFLTDLVREPNRDGRLLDLFTSRKRLVDNVKVGGHLGHGDHEMVTFSILE